MRALEPYLTLVDHSMYYLQVKWLCTPYNTHPALLSFIFDNCPWSVRNCPWSLVNPREKLPLVPARLFRGLPFLGSKTKCLDFPQCPQRTDTQLLTSN